MMIFQLLRRLGKLDRIDLARTHAGDVAAQSLRELLEVRDVRIGSPALTDSGVRDLCNLVSLQTLVITQDADQVTDAALSDFWRLVNLDSLQIDAPGVTGNSLSVLAELPKLRKLTLGTPRLTDQAFAKIAGSESLESIFIGNWNDGGPAAISDEGIQALAACESLKSLSIIRSGTQVTEESVQRLKQLRPKLNVTLR